MNFIKDSPHRRLLVVTYCNVVIVAENHLRFVICRRIARKRLVNVLKFRVHFYQN